MKNPATVTVFDDLQCGAKYERPFNLEWITEPPEFASKKKMPLFRQATFGDARTDKNSLKHKANVLTITGIELDYDTKDMPHAEQFTYEAMVALIEAKGVEASCYTSPSYVPGVTENWRVVLPFSQPFTGSLESMEAYHNAAVAITEDWFGMDFPPEVHRIAQHYYIGKVKGSEYQSTLFNGECIDEIEDPLDRAFAYLGGSDGSKMDFDAVTNGLVKGDDYHNNILSLLGHYAAKGVDIEAAIMSAQGYMLNVSGRRDEWQDRFDNIRRSAEWVYSKEGKKEKAKAKTQEHGAGFHMIKAANRKPEPLKWAVKDILEQQSTAALFGEPKSGKTFVVLDMALSIAAGIPYHGMETRQMPVAYIAGEGKRSLDRRIQAWCLAKDVDADSLPFFYSSRSTALLDPSRVEIMVAAMLGSCPDSGLMVIDTLARNLGGKENDNDDINKLFDVLDHNITPQFPGLTKLIVAHPGHGNKYRPRGGAALLGNIDSLMRLENKDGVVLLHSIFMKESENFDPMSFMLRPYGGENGSLVPGGLTDARDLLIADVAMEPESTVRERAERTGLPRSSISRDLKKIEAENDEN